MHIYVIRHAKPEVIDNDFRGAHLSKEGIEKTRELAAGGTIPKPGLVFSSPYIRTMETASVLCEVFDLDFEVKEFLKEWNIQSLNLPDTEFFSETRAGWEDHGKRVKGGESLDDLSDRACKGILNLVSDLDAGDIFVVTHGTFMEILCSAVSGRQSSLDNIDNMEFLAFAVLEYTGEKLKVIKDHLTLGS